MVIVLECLDDWICPSVFSAANKLKREAVVFHLHEVEICLFRSVYTEEFQASPSRAKSLQLVEFRLTKQRDPSYACFTEPAAFKILIFIYKSQRQPK